MVNRMVVRTAAAAVACEQCGYESLRTAELVNPDGLVLSRTLVCTICLERRRGESGRVPRPVGGAGYQGTAAGS